MGPATHTGPGALSIKVEYLQGAPPVVERFTHTQLHTQVLGSVHDGGHICLIRSSLLVVLYTRCRGVGGVFPAMGQRVRKLVKY